MQEGFDMVRTKKKPTENFRPPRIKNSLGSMKCSKKEENFDFDLVFPLCSVFFTFNSNWQKFSMAIQNRARTEQKSRKN